MSPDLLIKSVDLLTVQRVLTSYAVFLDQRYTECKPETRIHGDRPEEMSERGMRTGKDQGKAIGT